MEETSAWGARPLGILRSDLVGRAPPVCAQKRLVRSIFLKIIRIHTKNRKELSEGVRPLAGSCASWGPQQADQVSGQGRPGTPPQQHCCPLPVVLRRKSSVLALLRLPDWKFFVQKKFTPLSPTDAECFKKRPGLWCGSLRAAASLEGASSQGQPGSDPTGEHQGDSLALGTSSISFYRRRVGHLFIIINSPYTVFLEQGCGSPPARPRVALTAQAP